MREIFRVANLSNTSEMHWKEFSNTSTLCPIFRGASRLSRHSDGRLLHPILQRRLAQNETRHLHKCKPIYLSAPFFCSISAFKGAAPYEIEIVHVQPTAPAIKEPCGTKQNSSRASQRKVTSLQDITASTQPHC